MNAIDVDLPATSSTLEILVGEIVPSIAAEAPAVVKEKAKKLKARRSEASRKKIVRKKKSKRKTAGYQSI